MTAWLAAALGQPNPHIHTFTQSDDFLDYLKDARRVLPLIVTYTHGIGRINYQQDRNGNVYTRPIVNAPRLVLSPVQVDTSYLEPDDLDDLQFTVPQSEWPLMARRPIVLLTACDTGAAGVPAISSFDFPEVWLSLGARAVIATEGPVDAEEAYEFTIGVLGRLLRGVNVMTAMFETGVALMDLEDPNAVGLLYSYHGNPAVALVHSQ